MKYARVHRRPHANPKFFSLGNSCAATTCAAHMRNFYCRRPSRPRSKTTKYGNNFIHSANGAPGMCGIIFNWPGVNYAVNAAQSAVGKCCGRRCIILIVAGLWFGSASRQPLSVLLNRYMFSCIFARRALQYVRPVSPRIIMHSTGENHLRRSSAAINYDESLPKM